MVDHAGVVSGVCQGLRGLALGGLLLAVGLPAAQAGPVLDRIKSTKLLKVCIWPDYYGISLRHPKTQQLVGLDIELSSELAKDLGVKLEYVETAFPKLIDDLKNDRCDIAMFGVGATPARAQQLRFSQPYLQSDIYGVTTRSNRQIKHWEDIDQPGVQVAVQAGTVMEPVMTEFLKKAKVVVVKPPQTREQELESGRVDVFMTDYPYSRRLLDNADWARLLSPAKPFHVVDYAYPVKPGDDQWLAQVNQFVSSIKRDGRLKAAATRVGLQDIIVR